MQTYNKPSLASFLTYAYLLESELEVILGRGQNWFQNKIDDPKHMFKGGKKKRRSTAPKATKEARQRAKKRKKR